MKIRCGYEISYDVRQPSPMMLCLNVHPDRERDLLGPDEVAFDRPVRPSEYQDVFGNRCLRILAEPGPLTITNEFVIRDSGLPDEVAPDAIQHQVEDLPPEVLVYLLGSRYCETDKLSDTAWSLFGHGPRGWPLVQAIVNYAHDRITFGYQYARATKTAFDAHQEREGVCRDYAHLAVTLCRCMNIPARYATGYLGDIGIRPVDDPMDFSAWFEVYLGGRWYTFDARHNIPRIGRVVMARGRDATDVAIVTSFGPCILTGFKVTTDEVVA
ncbi:MAG TPA: transglutaminase family protein [Enterovirga sp.]|jgi:transglutaminase-like putative cysteine protease|nr:transglutaminase family protein [Enterovirga sp.]